MPTMGLPLAWLHNLDPFAVRLSGDFGVRWYGLSYVAGFIVAWLILSRLAKRRLILIKPEFVGDLILGVVVGTVIGGRLGYVLVYQPELLWTFGGDPPWWGLLAINKGGMASHGGMVGVIIACVLFARRTGLPRLHVIDCIGLVAPIGIFFGRVANFVNAELLGKIVAMPGRPAPWWSVKFPQELLERHAPPLSPDQSAALEALLAKAALPGEDRDQAIRRAIAEVQHANHELAAGLEPLISARHPSQLYQALAEGIILFVLLWTIWARPRRPGVITAWFLIAYGVGRIATELIRLPDAHLATPRFLGFSRGQWLSALMVLVGAWVLACARRSRFEAVGGWLRRAA